MNYIFHSWFMLRFATSGQQLTTNLLICSELNSGLGCWVGPSSGEGTVENFALQQFVSCDCGHLLGHR